MKFLDETGLTYLWVKIKSKFMAKPSNGTLGQVLTAVDADGNYAWADATGGISEAPSDSKYYSRKDGAWVESPSCDCEAMTNAEIDAITNEQSTENQPAD